MATIKNGTYLGIWTATELLTFQTYAVSFGDSPKLYPATKYKGGWVVRSKNFVLDTNLNFTKASGLVDADMAVLEASAEADEFGFNPPTGFTTPDGYSKLYDTEGRPYYVATSGTEDTNGDGVVNSADTATTVRSANIFTQVWDWAKANPFLAGAIVLGVVVIYQQMTQKGKRRKKILGLI